MRRAFGLILALAIALTVVACGEKAAPPAASPPPGAPSPAATQAKTPASTATVLPPSAGPTAQTTPVPSPVLGKPIEMPKAIPSTPRLVIGAYYAWYGTPSGPTKRWMHWQDGGGKELIKNHPADGYYDSADADALKRDIARAEKAGLDALAVSWWGSRDVAKGDAYIDVNFQKMLEAAKALGSPLKLAVLFESPGLADNHIEFLSQLIYIIDSYGGHPSYLKAQGKPVIFIYNPHYVGKDLSAWKQMFQALRAQGRDAFFVGESFDDDSAQVFNGLFLFGPLADIEAGAEKLLKTYRYGRQHASEKGAIWVGTALPGFDDSAVRKPTALIERRDGATYEETWRAVTASGADWAFISTWNEWHEGSEIAPSREYGERYLELTAKWAKEFRGE